MNLMALEKFIVPFRRWLTLAIQSRYETLASDNSLIYICVGEHHPTDSLSLSLLSSVEDRSSKNSLAQWKSNQIHRVNNHSIFLGPQATFCEESELMEESSCKKLRNEEVPSSHLLALGWEQGRDQQEQVFSLSRSVLCEVERFQMLEKRLLEEVGSEHGGNPKQRRKLFELELEGDHRNVSRRASRRLSEGSVREFLKECEEERRAFDEEYLREMV